ncbi:MAG TPA: TetR/AcrR family transcriptional regulator [Baekduia sp.]|nr:TetR/AcrR family transcriptional regulator [Baekduia sp.]
MPDRAQPRRRRLSAAERRNRILAAAQEVFALRGYHGSSLDEIAQASGTSKALIYEHFDSKRALHETLVAEHAGDLARRFAANAATGMTGEERLRGGVDAFFRWVAERPEAWRALFRDSADPELAPTIDRLQGQATRALVALVQRDPDAEGPPSEAIEMYARLTSGACQGLANWWLDHPEVPREHLVDRVLEFCWTGLERTLAEGA